MFSRIHGGGINWESRIGDDFATISGKFTVDGKHYRTEIKIKKDQKNSKLFNEKIAKITKGLSKSNLEAKSLSKQLDAREKAQEGIKKTKKEISAVEQESEKIGDQIKEMNGRIEEIADKKRNVKVDPEDTSFLVNIKQLDKEREHIVAQLNELERKTASLRQKKLELEKTKQELKSTKDDSLEWLDIQGRIADAFADVFIADQDARGDSIQQMTISEIAIQRYKKLAEGKEKAVYTLKSSSLEVSDESAYYIPHGFERGLRSETSTMEKIKERLPNQRSDFLALDAEKLVKEDGIDQKLTVKVPIAEGGNFELKLRDKKTTTEQRVMFGRQYIHGLKDLHSAGFAYGDPKPENCLVYNVAGQSVLRIADFGKTEEVGEKSATYTGNLRFASPEGALSKKGDVWGAAMILIRNFEEPYLSESTPVLLSVKKNDRDQGRLLTGDKERRGVERYVIEHKAFVATERSPDLKGRVRYLQRQMKKFALSKTRREECVKAMHDYIDELGKNMANDPSIGRDKAEKLAGLLKEMTRENPKERCDMDTVLNTYNEIFPGE